jgi:hypothetical protein
MRMQAVSFFDRFRDHFPRDIEEDRGLVKERNELIAVDLMSDVVDQDFEGLTIVSAYADHVKVQARSRMNPQRSHLKTFRFDKRSQPSSPPTNEMMPTTKVMIKTMPKPTA